MIDKLTRAKDDILNTITSYRDIKDQIDINTHEILSDDQLSELTWLKSQVDDWSQRSTDIAKEIKPTLRMMSGKISQYEAIATQQKNC